MEKKNDIEALKAKFGPSTSEAEAHMDAVLEKLRVSHVTETRVYRINEDGHLVDD